MVEELRVKGVDSISAWPIRDMEDNVDKVLAPKQEELDEMSEWVKSNDLESVVRLLRENSKTAYHTGRKLTLFPDGNLSSSWCNR